MSLSRSAIRIPPLALLVDSDADTCEMYAEWLVFSGFRVAKASTTKEALAKIRERRPHVIATGMALPDVDGCGLVAQLKADASTRTIPVIAVTGYVERTHLERAWLAGFDAVLTKPCPPARLLVEIQRLLTPGSTDAEVRRH